MTAEEKIYRMMSQHIDDPVQVEELISAFWLEVHAEAAKNLEALRTRLGPGHFGNYGMGMAVRILTGAETGDEYA